MQIETIGRILVTNPEAQKILELEKQRLVTQGWFKPNDLTINDDNLTRAILLGDSKLLSSHRGHISNQYSYIPLHIMTEYCRKKGLTISPEIDEKYKFKKTFFSNVTFLQTIKDRIKAYANGGEKFDYKHQTVPKRTIVSATGDLNAVSNEEKRRQKEEITLNEEFNKDIMRLRYEYLHWNAFYGEGKTVGDSIKKVATQPYQPNFEKGIRKREVRG